MSNPEFQPGNSFFATSIGPNDTTTFTLSGGRTVPFFFYLGSNSTVPFVRLESPVAQKEISWGDVAELPPGTNVTVRNISFMPGDIQLQSGKIPVTPPRRTSVSVAVTASETPGGATFYEPESSCDTRRAVRAYLSLALDPGDWVVTVTGYYKQHSRNQRTHTPAAYIDTYDFSNISNPAAVVPEMIPLGKSSDGNGMRMADYAVIVIQNGGLVVGREAFLDSFFVLEY